MKCFPFNTGSTVQESNQELINCVDESTRRCPVPMREELQKAVESQVDAVGNIVQYCFPGCEPIVKFLIDGVPRWTRDLDFTVHEGESYCRYEIFDYYFSVSTFCHALVLMGLQIFSEASTAHAACHLNVVS